MKAMISAKMATMITPVVIRNGPSWIRVPAQFKMAGISRLLTS